MATVLWGPEIASVYDETSAAMFDPAVLRPCVDVLASLAGYGAALEFAIGTGRVALALSARGVPVSGVELSPHMAEVMRRKPGAPAGHPRRGHVPDRDGHGGRTWLPADGSWSR